MDVTVELVRKTSAPFPASVMAAKAATEASFEFELPSRRPIVRSRIGALLSAGLLLGAETASATAADVAFGQYLAAECVTCHRADGEAKGIPSIVGWPAEAFVAAMRSYRDKSRPNPIMQTISARLTNEELAALAAYYQSLPAAK